MDPTGFAAPARVKSLVLPAGALQLDQFEQHYARLVQASEVPLIDVHLPSRPGMQEVTPSKQHFNPQANPTGRVCFDFETAAMPPYLKPLLHLEPWRQQLLVVGIAQFEPPHPHSRLDTTPEEPKATGEDENDSVGAEAVESTGSESCYEAMLSELRRRHSSALYHVLLVFGVNEEVDANSWPAAAFAIHEQHHTALESTLSTLTGEFLARLSTFWTTRQLSSFQSPSALMEGTQQSRHKHTPSVVQIRRSGSISMGSSERAKTRQEGRTLKFLGSLYLLSGLVPDALAQLGAAATILKDQNDNLWYGSALNEIAVCLVILKWEGNPMGIPSATVSAAWAVALSKIKNRRQSQSLEQAAAQAHARDLARDTSSHATGQSPNHSSRHSVSSLDEVSPRSSFSAAPIAALKKSKPFTDQTPLEDILEYIVEAVLNEFGLGKGSELVSFTVYYETVARFANLLICLRKGWSTEALGVALQASRHSISSSRANDLRPYPPVVIEKWISRVYDLSLHELSPDSQARILGTVAHLYAKAGLRRKWAFACTQIVSLLASTAATMDADLGHVDEVLQVYAKWPKLEGSLLRNLVALGQRIQNPRLQTEAASRLLRMTCQSKGVLLDKEQMTMYHLIRSYGDVLQSTFWDERVVVNATVKTHRLTTVRSRIRSPPPRSQSPHIRNSHHTHHTHGARKPPLSRSTSALSSRASSPFKPQSPTGGIIYNPFEGTEHKEEGSIERGIPTIGRIFLRNPLAIDIEVFELVLVDSQGRYVSDVVKDVVIPARSTQYKVEASVLPGEDSHLEVSGCYIQASGCTSLAVDLPTPVRIPVVPPRPILVLQSLSLLKGWTMLLEGEQQKFSMVLWNSSLNTPCEVLHFGFNDSTVDPLRQAVQKQDVSRADFFECEYFLHKRRALNLKGDPEQHIAPRASQVYEFDLFGKRGVSSAAVLVDYGLTEESLRRLKIPLQITIFPSISVERANILPTNSPSVVLVVLDLRNSWRDRLECKLWAEDPSNETEVTPVTQSINPNTTCRFLVKVPWSPLSLEELQRPIPSFSKRQYLVDNKTTPEQLQLFWLRERLLSRLHGRWSSGPGDQPSTPEGEASEVPNSNGRHGYIELRTIQLTRRMADVLKTSVVEVKADPVTKAEVDKPTSLGLTIVNKSSEPIQGMLRLVANKAAMRYMLVLGANQCLVSIPAEGSIRAKFDLLFLSHGPFELSSVLDPVPSARAPSSSQGVFQSSQTVITV